MIFYEPHARDRELLPHDPFKAIVAPRPIGWVSTIGPDGELNLAPYSFFNAIGENPPMVAFSSSGAKHSSTFAGGAGEFVWNLADLGPARANELDIGEAAAGRERVRARGARGRAVAARRAAARRRLALRARVPRGARGCARRCRRDAADQYLVVGQVVGVHVDEAAIRDGRVDTAALRPIARCGYLGDYAVVDELFEMLRPD